MKSLSALLALALAPVCVVPVTRAEEAPQPAVRMRIAGAETAFRMLPGRMTAFTTPKGQTFGVQIAKQGTTLMRIELLQARVDARPRSLERPEFTLVESFVMSEGSAAARVIGDGVSVEVDLPIGMAKDFEIDEDTTAGCCVTCSNGVEICGSRVRSSCGNCN